MQAAGSCWWSPAPAPSQGRQASRLLFQTHRTPGQAWKQAAGPEKAEQLGEVYTSTSLSSRLLKPPNTYITLQDDTDQRLA